MTPPTPAVCGDWTGCYAEGWRGIITPESFAHPAKMARGLLRRILRHAQDAGWIEPGGLVVDPFGGIGSTGIEGAEAGLHVVCHELEPRFCEMAKANFALHARRWETWKRPAPVMLCGDSRRLSESLASAGLVVSSPPFAESLSSGRLSEEMKAEMRSRGHKPSASGESADYGQTPGQLGAMKAGDVAAVIGSPPFQDGVATGDPNFLTPGEQGKRVPSKSNQADYGASPGQLARMIVGSPPYAEIAAGAGGLNSKPGKDGQQSGRSADSASQSADQRYGASDGQLARMIVGSPPYNPPMSQDHNGRGGGTRGVTPSEPGAFVRYGNTPGQLEGLPMAAESGETFWSAAADILRECHKILRPGGHAIWVCKDFVRKGQRVPFSDDWLRLCEATGFQLVCRHRAMLTSDDGQPGLFGDGPRVKSRKSFFRRLAERKGSPAIDWEDVLCLVKL